ncbi:hypothetical protein ACHAWF_012818 [Thalassiosira exigua]
MMRRTLDQYANMTLDDLADLDDADDEEIDEDEAFNSEDEARYRKFFSPRRPPRRKGNQCKNLSLPIPLQHGTVRVVQVPEGCKVVLSSICLDVCTCDFERVRVMYRCVGPDQTMGKADDFACICNYLATKNGGMGLMPSTPVSLEVIGPCKMEFRAEVAPSSLVDGGINIFGIIIPLQYHGSDIPHQYPNALRSKFDDNLEEEAPLSNSDGENNKADNGGRFLNATRKRKLEEVVEKAEAKSADERQCSEKKNSKGQRDDAVPGKDNKAEEILPASDNVTGVDANCKQPNQLEAGATPTNQSNGTKLSKKQRKKLAQEKAKQLEETLSAARNNLHDGTNDSSAKKSAKKKKKKQSLGESGSIPKTTSLTRERRLAGGLIVSDILLGTGAPVRPGKRISLHYTGSLRSTGKVFDKNASKQHPLVLRQGTGEVIRGLERGLEGMKVGGERVITIPSKLGYGSKGQGDDIPPDSDLVFEVKVLKVG